MTNPGTAGATETACSIVDPTPYDGNALALQPDGTREIDPLDDRYSSVGFEYKAATSTRCTPSRPPAPPIP